MTFVVKLEVKLCKLPDYQAFFRMKFLDETFQKKSCDTSVILMKWSFYQMQCRWMGLFAQTIYQNNKTEYSELVFSYRICIKSIPFFLNFSFGVQVAVKDRPLHIKRQLSAIENHQRAWLIGFSGLKQIEWKLTPKSQI